MNDKDIGNKIAKYQIIFGTTQRILNKYPEGTTNVYEVLAVPVLRF
jgi:hypothetical protein